MAALACAALTAASGALLASADGELRGDLLAAAARAQASHPRAARYVRLAPRRDDEASLYFGRFALLCFAAPVPLAPPAQPPPPPAQPEPSAPPAPPEPSMPPAPPVPSDVAAPVVLLPEPPAAELLAAVSLSAGGAAADDAYLGICRECGIEYIAT